MADRSLVDTYLERLDAALPLADAERDAAVEEIAAHVADATADLVERGLPADVAERRALSRLGAPQRLADDLAAAHRGPRDLLVAAGVALRLSVVTAIWSVLATWILLFVIGLGLGLAWAVADRLLTLPRIDWTPLVNAPLVAATMAMAGYAVGRAIVRPVALAAHRPERMVRVAVLAIGIPMAAWLGLAWIELGWNLPGALLAALTPAWFALGVMRPGLLPARFPLGRPRIGLALVAVIVISIAGLAVASGAPTEEFTGIGRKVDPRTEFAAIATFDAWESPALEPLGDGAAGAYGRGAGPITWTEAWRVTGSAQLAGWTDVRAEVWVTPDDPGIGPVVAPGARRIGSAPLTLTGRRAGASVTFEAMPEDEYYYVAVVGLDADGQRQLLAWPSFRQWTWSGTPWNYFAVLARR